MNEQNYPNTVPADHSADLLFTRNADGTSTFECVPLNLSTTRPTALAAAMAGMEEIAASDRMNVLTERQPAKEHFADEHWHNEMESILSSLPAATAETLDALIQSNEPVVIDFWSRTCLPCKQMAQTVHEAAEKLQGRVGLYGFEVNAAAGLTFFEERDIPGLSSYIVYQSGRELACLSGLQGVDTLVAAIEAAIEVAKPLRATG